MKAAISSEGSQEIQKEKGKSENKERIMRRISIIGLKKNWEGRKKKKNQNQAHKCTEQTGGCQSEGREWGRRWVKWVEGVKRYKRLVIK